MSDSRAWAAEQEHQVYVENRLKHLRKAKPEDLMALLDTIDSEMEYLQKDGTVSRSTGHRLDRIAGVIKDFNNDLSMRK